MQVVVGVGLGEFAEVHEIGPRQGTEWAGNRQAPEPVGKQAKVILCESHPGRGREAWPTRGKPCVLGVSTAGVRASGCTRSA